MIEVVYCESLACCHGVLLGVLLGVLFSSTKVSRFQMNYSVEPPKSAKRITFPPIG